jgi:hypothetical protein
VFGLCSLSGILKSKTSEKKIQFREYFHYNTGQWTKYNNSVILSIIHHHKNPLELILCVTFSQGFTKVPHLKKIILENN